MPLILPGNVGSATAATGYDVANSLRFNDDSTDYLSRTPGSDGNRKTWTFSTWIKRGNIGIGNPINVFGGEDGGSRYSDIMIGTPSGADDTFWFKQDTGTVAELRSTMKLRDTAAWYHLVFTYDSTDSTAADRMKMYVNGVRLTSFVTNTNAGSNVDSYVNTSGDPNYIGIYQASSKKLDAYLCETVLIDGTALAADSFGEFDSDSGIWKPIDVSGLTFGTNGFYLDFEDSSALGNDAAGSNNFTVNNLTAIDQSTDTCTNNFATWNNLLGIQIPDTFSESNLVLTMGQNAWRTTFSTIAASSGKFYAEVKWVTGSEFTAGFGNAQSYSVDQDLNDLVADPGGDGYVSVIYKNGALYENGSNTSTGYSTYSSGDIIMLAMDLDNYKLYLGVGGTWGKSGDPAGNSNGVAIPSANQGDFFHFAVSTYGNTQASGNFGSPQFSISSGNTDGNGYGNFEYAVPSGFFSLNSKNLAEFG